MASGLGEAVGLGFRQPQDNTNRWLRQIELEEERKQNKAAAEAKRKKDFITSADFKVDTKSLYPPNATAVTEIYADYLNKVIELQDADPIAAENVIRMLRVEAQAAIGQEYKKSELFDQYAKQDPSKYHVNPDVIAAYTNPNMTNQELATGKYRYGDFVGFGPGGEIQFRAIERFDPSKFLKDWKVMPEPDTTHTVRIPGTNELHYRIVERATEADKAQKAQQIASQQEFIFESSYQDPALAQMIVEAESTKDATEKAKKQAQVNALLLARARKIVDEAAPADAYDSAQATIPVDRVGAGGKEKKVGVVAYNVPFTRHEGDEAGTSTAPSENNYPVVYSVSEVTKDIPLSVSNDMISVANNKPFAAEGNAILFRPQQVVSYKTKGGPVKAFVLGYAVESKGAGDQTWSDPNAVNVNKTNKTIAIYVPLEKVRPMIEEHYTLKPFDDAFKKNFGSEQPKKTAAQKKPKQGASKGDPTKPR